MTPFEFSAFLSVVDVAEVLGVSVVDVHALIASGELGSIRVGDAGPVRVAANELDAFIAHRYEVEQKLLRVRQAEFSNVTDFTDGRLL